MPKVIQFLHTAVEAKPNKDDDLFIPWNNHPDHRRKFILSEGKFVNSDDKEVDENLAFWGEWEAQSEVTRLRAQKRGLPRYLNRPYIDPSVPNRTHNTDPYVFGKSFKYIICKQTTFQNALVGLEENSMILFGSSKGGKFCLDTVFIVSKEKINYTRSTLESLFPVGKRGQYYYASVNPINGQTNCNPNVADEDSCRVQKDKSYTFYKGVDFANRHMHEGMYSFVPAKRYNPDNESVYTFQQPKIELDFLRPRQKQGINGSGQEYRLEEITEYWQAVAHQIENHGLLKATRFKTPPLYHNKTAAK